MTTNETLLFDYAGNNQPRIVVMGGSFNPPTKAHYQLLQTAMEGLHAVKGIFVPDSRPYLKRKMRRAGGVQVCFSEAERASMLECMAADDARMEVSTIEFGTYMPRTLETMCELSRLHQGAELYFLIGTDKLTMLSHMKPDSPFLNTIRFVVFDREGEEAECRIAEDATLSQVAGNFTCLSAPPGVEGVSSSLIREQYLRGEIPYDTLHPGVAAMLEQIPADRFHEEIFRFEDKYAFLTLKYPASIIFEDFIDFTFKVFNGKTISNQ